VYVHVRRATAADARTLAELRWRWRGEEFGESITRDEFLALFEAWVLGHLDTHTPYLAEVDGEPAGMAWLMVADRVPAPDRPARRYGDVQSVYVVPSLRDAGIGGRLIGAVLDDARARGLEHATVHSSERAVPFYHRLGFRDGQRWFEWRP